MHIRDKPNNGRNKAKGKEVMRECNKISVANGTMKQKAYDMLTSEDLMGNLLSKAVTVPSENIVIGNPFADLLSR